LFVFSHADMSEESQSQTSGEYHVGCFCGECLCIQWKWLYFFKWHFSLLQSCLYSQRMFSEEDATGNCRQKCEIKGKCNFHDRRFVFYSFI